MLECGFESQLGLEFSGFSMWHFLKLFIRGFLQVLWDLSLIYRLMVSANKINVISTLSNVLAELSLHTMFHMYVISA